MASNSTFTNSTFTFLGHFQRGFWRRGTRRLLRRIRNHTRCAPESSLTGADIYICIYLAIVLKRDHTRCAPQPLATGADLYISSTSYERIKANP